MTQLPNTVADDDIIALNQAGIRAVRFNLKRGGSENIGHLSSMASRVDELAGWHVELYVDASDLPELYPTLIKLPSVSLDHLGLSKAGFKTVVQLAEKGVRIKASGFGRVDFPVTDALKTLYTANPTSLMFGTDLPSTRSPKAYSDADFMLVIEALGTEAATKVLHKNALDFYQIGYSSVLPAG